MNHIIQRFPYDCSVACVAMFLGITWEEAFEKMGSPTQGVPINETAEFLWKHDWDVEWSEGKMPTGKSLVVVESLNQPPKRHMVYFDGSKVFDPSPGEKTYCCIHSVKAGLFGILEGPLAPRADTAPKATTTSEET